LLLDSFNNFYGTGVCSYRYAYQFAVLHISRHTVGCRVAQKSACHIMSIYWQEQWNFHTYVALKSFIGINAAEILLTLHVKFEINHSHFFLPNLHFTHFALSAIKHKCIYQSSWNLVHIKGSLKHMFVLILNGIWWWFMELWTIICIKLGQRSVMPHGKPLKLRMRMDCTFLWFEMNQAKDHRDMNLGQNYKLHDWLS